MPRRKQKTFNTGPAIDSRRVPEGVRSIEVTIRLPEELAEKFLKMKPIERGQVCEKGFDAGRRVEEREANQ